MAFSLQIPAGWSVATFVAIAVGVGAFIKWIIDALVGHASIRRANAELEKAAWERRRRDDEETIRHKELTESLARLRILTPDNPRFEEEHERLMDGFKRDLAKLEYEQRSDRGRFENLGEFQKQYSRAIRGASGAFFLLFVFCGGSFYWLGSRVQDYKIELVAARSELDHLRTQLSTVELSRDKISQEASASSAALVAARSELDRLQKQLSAVELSRDSISKIRQYVAKISESTQKLEYFYSRHWGALYADPHSELEGMRSELKSIEDLLAKLDLAR